jgi:glycosyltransferase involved in cell wall biosynthesis
MKILLLADPNSPHIIKWVRGLSERGINIEIFGLSILNTTVYEDLKNVRVNSYGFERAFQSRELSSLSKLKYLTVLKRINKIIKEFQPDIVHAHFASSYGLLCALLNFKPKIVSVWGSDVYTFPKNSFLHKMVFKFNLRRMDMVFSTSIAMANEIRKYYKSKIEIIPFGIDFIKFSPQKVDSIFDESDIVIGNLKRLESKYGLEYLISAFKIVVDKHPSLPLKLMIAGIGVEENNLKAKVEELEIKDKVKFIGDIEYDKIEIYHNMITIHAVTSLSESFGVSVIEASACEKPVVVSNVGGLPEVVIDNKTGFIVSAADPISIANGIEKLVLNEKLRNEFGKNGRNMVMQKYKFEENLDELITKYNELI